MQGDNDDDDTENTSEVFVPSWAEGTEADALDGETAAAYDERIRMLYTSAGVPAGELASFRMTSFLPVDDMYYFTSSSWADTRPDGIVIPRNSAFDPSTQGWEDTGREEEINEVAHKVYKSGNVYIYVPL